MATPAKRIFVTAQLLLAVGIVLALGAVTIGPHLFAYRAMVLRSGSMSPAIPTGSLVFYRPAHAPQLQVGDVVAFPEPGRPATEVTHRVYAIDRGRAGESLITKGDANDSPDAWRLPVTARTWKASWSVPAVGYPLLYLESVYGRLLLIAVGVVLAGAALLRIRPAPAPEGPAPSEQ